MYMVYMMYMMYMMCIYDVYIVSTARDRLVPLLDHCLYINKVGTLEAPRGNFCKR